MTKTALHLPPQKNSKKAFPLRVGQKVYVSRMSSEGFSSRHSELWTVTEIAPHYVQFYSDNGDYVRMIR